MKLLLACEHHPITPARFLANAFDAMPDVDLRHIGTDRGAVTSITDELRPDKVWKSQGDYHHFWSDWRPDLVLYFDTIHAYYHHSRYHAVPHVWYHIEGVMDNIMPGMAHYFHATSYGANWEKVPDKMTWLPPAYDPAVHTPSPIPWEDREYDVCLVGRRDDKRKSHMAHLEAAGLSVFYGLGLIDEDFATAYHNARISYVEHFYNIVPMRTMETAAMGNLLYSQWLGDYDKLGIRGVVAHPDSIEQFENVARELIERPEECKALVAQSMGWVKPHTYAARALTILEWFEENN